MFVDKSYYYFKMKISKKKKLKIKSMKFKEQFLFKNFVLGVGFLVKVVLIKRRLQF